MNYKDVVNDIKGMLDREESPIIDTYTPKVVSIGPFHHHNPRLQNMERVKLIYFNKFLELGEINLESLVSMWKRPNLTFVDLMLIPLTLPRKSLLDLLLIENQLPFFILESLYNRAFISGSVNIPSFLVLTFDYFAYYNSCNLVSDNIIIRHLTDLLRMFHLQKPIERRPPCNTLNLSLQNYRLELEEKREKRAFQEQGALGLILELEKSVDMNNGKKDASNERNGSDLSGNELFGGSKVGLRHVYASEGGRELVGVYPTPNGDRRIIDFLEKFLHKYFPADLKRKKEMEFLKLEQGNMSVGEYAAKFEELARFCPYSELEVNGRSKCSKFESGLRPKLKIMFGHQEIADFATLVNKCRMYEDDLKSVKLATPETISPRDYGPQRNHLRERGKEMVEDDRKPYAATTRHRDRNFQRSRPFTVPIEGVSTPMCNKCGRRHLGSTCPGSGNGCFHCKEFGHIKRFCPKLDRRPNVIPAEEARDHGRMVTPSGAWTSGVDDPARVCIDMYVYATGSWKPRLSERFSPERERITWEGEIVGYTGGFSLERELSRLGEKWQFWVVDTCNRLHNPGLELEEKREKRAFQEQGALGLILELEKRVNMKAENEDVKDNSCIHAIGYIDNMVTCSYGRYNSGKPITGRM
ncbi:hypothetical protein Lal_00046695 [Lupinus albus]|nr:hypothetical protein Lal_00046695 [Lupinus albus]